MKNLKVLGTGCAKCHKLADLAERAAREIGIEYELEKVTEIPSIVAFGVMATPALVVDGKVVVAGRVPTYPEMKSLIA